MLDNGNEKDWFHSNEIVIATVIGVVVIAFLTELTDRHPIVDLHLFQRRNFRVGTISIAVAYFTFMGINVIFLLWLQTALNYTSTRAGSPWRRSASWRWCWRRSSAATCIAQPAPGADDLVLHPATTMFWFASRPSSLFG
jgi:hypothetical protein